MVFVILPSGWFAIFVTSATTVSILDADLSHTSSSVVFSCVKCCFKFERAAQLCSNSCTFEVGTSVARLLLPALLATAAMSLFKTTLAICRLMSSSGAVMSIGTLCDSTMLSGGMATVICSGRVVIGVDWSTT